MLNIFTKTNSNNFIIAVEIFLKKLKVNITGKTVSKMLNEHPFYPSIYCISEAFNTWKIDNTVIRLQKENVQEAPVPFIAHINQNGGLFVVVNKITENNIEYQDSPASTRTIPLEHFWAVWQGVSLFAEAGPESGEKDYVKARKKEQLDNLVRLLIPLTLVGLLLAGALSHILSSTFFSWGILSLLKFTGVATCLMLVAQDLNLLSPALQKVCTFNSRVSCTDITTSKASRLFGFVSWGDLGLVYFAGGFFTTLTAPQGSGTMAYLAWLNLLSLPFIVYSLVYQGMVAKKWCPLCLAVLVVLLLETIAFYFTYWIAPVGLAFLPAMPLFTCFGLSVFLVAYIKPLWPKITKGEETGYELTRLKRNKDIFEAMTARQQPIGAEPDGVGITLGNLRGEQTLVKVCSPFCGPCAKAHPQIEELLAQNPMVQVKIIFFVNGMEEDEGSRVAMHLMALYKELEPATFQKALHDWYSMEKKNYEGWSACYPVKEQPIAQKEEIVRMLQWCTQAQIEHTPTFFVNNRKLPDMYSIGDLVHLFRQ